MSFLLQLARRIDGILTIIGKAAGWLAIPLMLVIVADVLLRRYFVIGSTMLQELEWHLHGALFLLCLGYAYVRGAHVRIDLVHERLDPRQRAWVEALGCLLLLIPYCLAGLYFGWEYAERSFLLNEGSASQTGLGSRWFIKGVMVLGFVLLGLAGLARLFRAVVFLFGPRDLAVRTGFALSPQSDGRGTAP